MVGKWTRHQARATTINVLQQLSMGSKRFHEASAENAPTPDSTTKVPAALRDQDRRPSERMISDCTYGGDFMFE
jgi:hypothetical protein